MSPQLQAWLALLMLIAGTLGSLAVLLGPVSASERVRRGLGLAVGGLVCAALWASVAPTSLPVSWLMPLQEGSSDTFVTVARGEGGHAGWVFDRLLLWPLVGTARRLDTLVVFHLAAGLAATLAVAALLRAASGRGGVVAAFVLAWCLATPVRWAVWSEGPAPLIWLGLLAIAATWWGARKAGRAWRGVAATSVVCWSVLLAGLRVETTAIPVAIAAIELLARTSWPARVDAAVRGAWRHTRDRPAAAVGVVLALGCATWLAYDLVLPGHQAKGELSWVISTLHPLDPSPLAWPWLLLATWPAGLAVLVVVGVGVGLRHPVRTGGLGLVLFVLLRLYASAAHGGFVGRRGDLAFFEVVRYLGFVAPLVVAVGWQGHRWLAERLPRLATLLLVACVFPPLPAAALVWPRTTVARQQVVPSSTTLDRDAQREVRALVTLFRAHPRCRFAVRTGAAEWTTFPGPGLTVPRSELRARTTTEGPRPTEASCTIVVHGLACALADCAPLDREEEVGRWGVDGPPYAHPQHGWGAAGPYDIVAWRLAGEGAR